MSWRIVSYYTEDYMKWAEPFFLSVAKFTDNWYIEGITGTDNWNQNVAGKMSFIRRMLDKYPDDNIVWCDIDAKLTNYPELFDQFQNFEVDFAAHKRMVTRENRDWILPQYGFTPKYLYYTGTMFFKNNDKVRRFLDRWIQIHEQYKDCKRPTQASLYMTLQEVTDLNIYDLPEMYCWIKPYTVFEHYCASGENT